MIAVIFEVWPKPERKQDYLDIAAPGKILSLSFFRDEEAVKAWRNLVEHRAAQEKGRKELFADYRLRIASVIRDYGMTARGEVPADSRERHK
jgi:heme-degrading monooxygenase HmoA